MSPRRTNRSELDDLTSTQRTAVQEGAVALDNLVGRGSFNAWMQVARGIVPLCALADKPGRSRYARRSLLKEAGYGRLSPANISRLLHMGRFESQIQIWRMGLKPRQRDTWNSPATICKKCPEVRKAIEEANKDKPPRQARPRPTNPSDELERAINRVFDLLNAVEDLDLRRQQIERLTMLLGELSEPEQAPKKKRGKRKSAINGALEWKSTAFDTHDDDGKAITVAEYKAADHRGGYYCVSFACGSEVMPSRRTAYEILQRKGKKQRSLGYAATADEAKAIAERDHRSPDPKIEWQTPRPVSIGL
jgi:hypothetical protein